jgi:hypothetical protein
MQRRQQQNFLQQAWTAGDSDPSLVAARGCTRASIPAAVVTSSWGSGLDASASCHRRCWLRGGQVPLRRSAGTLIQWLVQFWAPSPRASIAPALASQANILPSLLRSQRTLGSRSDRLNHAGCQHGRAVRVCLVSPAVCGEEVHATRPRVSWASSIL